MTDFKIKLRAEVKLAVQDVLEKDFPFQSCINCREFQENEICKLYGVRPPAKIIVIGCKEWTNINDIPY